MKIESENPGELLSERKVSNLLGVDASTLCRWRQRDEAPPYVQYPSGRVFYPQPELKKWVDDCWNEGGGQ